MALNIETPISDSAAERLVTAPVRTAELMMDTKTEREYLALQQALGRQMKDLHDLFDHFPSKFKSMSVEVREDWKHLLTMPFSTPRK